MRSHTLGKHGIQITNYKDIHGPFEIIETVFHKCYLCGKLVLLDSDALGGHIKGTHKMKEKDYKEKYCNYASVPRNNSKVETETADILEGNAEPFVATGAVKKKMGISKRQKIGKLKKKKAVFNPFTDIEYGCNLRDCDECGRSSLVVELTNVNMDRYNSEEGTSYNIFKEVNGKEKKEELRKLFKMEENMDVGIQEYDNKMEPDYTDIIDIVKKPVYGDFVKSLKMKDDDDTSELDDEHFDTENKEFEKENSSTVLPGVKKLLFKDEGDISADMSNMSMEEALLSEETVISENEESSDDFVLEESVEVDPSPKRIPLYTKRMPLVLESLKQHKHIISDFESSLDTSCDTQTSFTDSLDSSQDESVLDERGENVGELENVLFQDDDDRKDDTREEEGVTEDEEISEEEPEEQERSYSEILEDLDVLFTTF